MFSHFGKYAYILELGSPVQELGYLSKNFDPGQRNWNPCWSRNWNYDPISRYWDPGSGTAFRARELGFRTGTSQKRLEIGIPNPRTNLDRTVYKELAPGPIQELLRYLGPRELGSRIQKLESRGLETEIPEPKKLVPRTKGTRIPDSKA